MVMILLQFYLKRNGWSDSVKKSLMKKAEIGFRWIKKILCLWNPKPVVSLWPGCQWWTWRHGWSPWPSCSLGQHGFWLAWLEIVHCLGKLLIKQFIAVIAADICQFFLMLQFWLTVILITAGKFSGIWWRWNIQLEVRLWIETCHFSGFFVVIWNK